MGQGCVQDVLRHTEELEQVLNAYSHILDQAVLRDKKIGSSCWLDSTHLDVVGQLTLDAVKTEDSEDGLEQLLLLATLGLSQEVNAAVNDATFTVSLSEALDQVTGTHHVYLKVGHA